MPKNSVTAFFREGNNMKNLYLASVQLMRADRPVGTVLLATPMLWALWLASNGHPNANIVLIFLLGSFVMRSAGCVINDFADRKIDLNVERTKERPLTSGKVSSRFALLLFVFLILCALCLLMFLPTSAIIPAVVAFILASLYPFTKRFFIIPQLVLGLAYAMSILMAYVTVLGTMPLEGWILFFASTLWTIVYDTFYAMVDKNDDVHLGIHSSALLFGSRDLIILKVCAVLFLGLIVAVGIIHNSGVYYYLGVLGSASCFFYQFYITRQRERANCFTAFLNNQWVGVFVFLGILLDSLN